MSLPTSCPLCTAGSQDQFVVTSHVFGDETHSRAFFRCSNCEVHYQFPPLTPDEEEKFYTAEFESFMESRAGTSGGWQKAEKHVDANETTRIRRMKYLQRIVDESQEILEVGCSSGFMLFPLQKKGKRCVGIEPSGVFSEYVSRNEIPVFHSVDELVNSHSNVQFDLIMHFFVLEHISAPLDFLKLQLSMLKPGGRIVLEIPNVADPLYTVYDIPAFERFYWSVAHPWYFSEKSINFLLSELGQGYEIIRDQRYDLSNHMVWARDGKPGGMGKFTPQLGEELEETYKASLIRNGTCDTLVAVITKNA